MRKIFQPTRLNIEGYSGNKLKDLVQTDVNDVLDEHGSVVAEMTTGFGKTVVALKAIRKRTFSLINIVVPTEALYKQWIDRLTKENLLDRVQGVYIINTYTMTGKVEFPDPDLLIVDEAHRCLNEQSVYFSQLLQIAPNSQKLLLSASLDVKHKAFLDELGINVYYVVTRNWAFRHGLVPYHTAMNVPVDLTPVEMSDYLVAQDTIDKESKFFYAVGVYDPYVGYSADRIAAMRGIPVGAVYGKHKKWRNAYDTRKQILYNASNKEVILKEMLQYVSEKAMIFCKSIDYVKKLVEDDLYGVQYHSKLKKSERTAALESFFSNLYPRIYSVDGLKEGVDVPPDCRLVFRMAYEKNERDTTQITGRASRFDENNLEKESFMFNFYVRNFMARGKEVQSKELDWLKSNQKSEYNVIWFDEADDAINFVKETFQKHDN
jgi:superfamily II DNA or RNA helicase